MAFARVQKISETNAPLDYSPLTDSEIVLQIDLLENQHRHWVKRDGWMAREIKECLEALKREQQNRENAED